MSKQNNTKDWILLLQDIADAATDIALHYFDKKNFSIQSKADQSPVSQADLEIEDEIRRIISSDYADYSLSIIGEEYGETKGESSTKLIIDPIDGTKNFIKGLPYFATLLAIEEEGVVTAGLVSAPATKERWWAAKGKGSFYNGQAQQVSNVAKLEESLAMHGSLFGSEASDEPQKVLSLLEKTFRQRGFGDYVPHMMVAMGLAEFAIDFKLKVWDVAALKIIVEEAGGSYSDTAGTSSIYSGNIVSSNGLFHKDVVSALDGLC